MNFLCICRRFESGLLIRLWLIRVACGGRRFESKMEPKKIMAVKFTPGLGIFEIPPPSSNETTTTFTDHHSTTQPFNQLTLRNRSRSSGLESYLRCQTINTLELRIANICFHEYKTVQNCLLDHSLSTNFSTIPHILELGTQ
ncbi:unnamed protein product [Ambrosiozyma monospora]|uniref:Unnamed protein product n=1 Tax=Ambrosiozyma monospora TaxID=43982 RepID=A0ACB5U3L8_AMBMO|nr:unnamed protein product [Ambrosiozyma monospora]